MKLKNILNFLIFISVTNYILSQNLTKIYPISIKASSAYKKAGPVDHIMDGSIKTYWNPKKNKGEYVELKFESPTDIKQIKIFTGLANTKKDYFRNNRPGTIAIQIDDKEKTLHILEDTYEFKTIVLNSKKTKKLKIIIVDRILGGYNTRNFTNYISELEIYSLKRSITNNFNLDVKKLKEENLSYYEIVHIYGKLPLIYKDLYPEDKEIFNKLIQSQLKYNLNIAQQNIENLSNNYSSLSLIHNSITDINNRYLNTYQNNEEIESILYKARLKKSKLLEFHYDNILNQINNATSGHELENLKKIFLEHTEPTAITYELKQLIASNEKRLNVQVVKKQEEKFNYNSPYLSFNRNNSFNKNFKWQEIDLSKIQWRIGKFENEIKYYYDIPFKVRKDIPINESFLLFMVTKKNFRSWAILNYKKENIAKGFYQYDEGKATYLLQSQENLSEHIKRGKYYIRLFTATKSVSPNYCGISVSYMPKTAIEALKNKLASKVSK